MALSIYDQEVHLYGSKGSFPVRSTIGREGKGRREGKMDSFNTSKVQIQLDKDSEGLSVQTED